jgi:hypothetical protein
MRKEWTERTIRRENVKEREKKEAMKNENDYASERMKDT